MQTHTDTDVHTDVDIPIHITNTHKHRHVHTNTHTHVHAHTNIQTLTHTILSLFLLHSYVLFLSFLPSLLAYSQQQQNDFFPFQTRYPACTSSPTCMLLTLQALQPALGLQDD